MSARTASALPVAHVREGRRVVAQHVSVADDAAQQVRAARGLDLLADHGKYRPDAALSEKVEQRRRVLAVGSVVEREGTDETLARRALVA